MQWVADTLLHVKFTGVVEIDESMFGRPVKYHKGNPNVGLKVWIVGLVERSSGRLLLLPVDDRSAETLEGIIGRHVVRSATIYTDGWAGYSGLSAMGYDRFVVQHKYEFRAMYHNVVTGDIIKVNTNGIQGAWQHAKVSIHIFFAWLIS